MGNPCEFVLDARNIKMRYGDHQVLKGIDISVRAGEVICIIGPSGSGKSTFLRCLNGLEKCDEGYVKVNGNYLNLQERNGRYYELSPQQTALRRRAVGMVFQQFNLFPNYTVLENITLAPRVTGKYSRRQAEQKARALLERVGLGHRANAMPDQLSGGQQQRVAIARALAMEPDLMLFDEPTSALDPELVDEVLKVIRDLAANGMTMVIVTHEMTLAEDISDKVMLIDNGERLQYGTAQEVLRNPLTERAQVFLSRLNR